MSFDYIVESYLLTLNSVSLLIAPKFWRNIKSVVNSLPTYVIHETDRVRRVCHQLVFIAPPRTLGGMVLENRFVEECDFIYHLSPELQGLDDAEIQGVIAIQFADAMIRQREHLLWKELGKSLSGTDAEQLAKRWKFQTSSRLKTPVDYVQHHDEQGNYLWDGSNKPIMARESLISPRLRGTASARHIVSAAGSCRGYFGGCASVDCTARDLFWIPRCCSGQRRSALLALSIANSSRVSQGRSLPYNRP
jgi:hypothetical protein